MEQGATGHPSRRSINRLGLATDPRQANAPLVVNNETTAWEIYNDRALTIDREIIKDWNDSLNILLIFAALYSAILTAFIIETSNSPTTPSRPSSPAPFVAPAWAIRVNYYFFIAISCTLVAALAAVLALQWVGSYDAGLNPSSPEGRALQRHVRYQGVEKWRMVQIIAFLPALIFVALFLFFVGLAEWMWTIHQGVAGVIIASVIFGAAFSLVTTIIGMVYVGAPFRTLGSRSLAGLFVGIYYSIFTIGYNLEFKHILATFRRLGRYAKNSLTQLTLSRRQQSPRSSRMQSTLRFLQFPHRLSPFEEREKEMVQSIADIKLTALIWLANRIDVLPHNVTHFQSLFREILLLPPEQLMDIARRPAPWPSVFELLLGSNHTSPNSAHFPVGVPSGREDANELMAPDFSDRDTAWQVFTLLGSGEAYDMVFNYNEYKNCRTRTKVVITLASSVQKRRHWSRVEHAIHVLNATLTAVGILPANLLAAHLLIVRELGTELRDFDLSRNYMYRGTHYRGSGYSRRLSTTILLDHMSENPARLFPDQILDILLDIFVLRFSPTPSPGNTALERYIHAASFFFAMGSDDFGIHDAIVTQVVGGMLRRVKEYSEKPDVDAVLSPILRLLQANLQPRTHSAVVACIFHVLRRFGEEIWDDDEDRRVLTARIYAAILPPAYCFAGDDWADWALRFYTGLDALSERAEWSSASKRRLIWEQARIERDHHQRTPKLSTLQVRHLLEIKDPILWLYASTIAGPEWAYPRRIPKVLLAGNEDAQHCVQMWQVYKSNQPHWSHSELLFTRSLALAEGNHSWIWRRLPKIQTIDEKPMSSSDWLSFLHEPVLGIILRDAEFWMVELVLGILLRVCHYPWFCAEFRAADGFRQLLELFRFTEGDRVATLICSSLDFAEGESSVVSWVQVLYQLLINYRNVRPFREPEVFAEAVSRVYSAQKLYRRAAGDSARAGALAAFSDALNGAQHDYVSAWSDTQWRQWQEMIEEIPGGLRRGYIRIEPSERTSRFVHDPDGACCR